MRDIKIPMTEAERKRWPLALRYAEFGLPDPLGPVRDAGFGMRRDDAHIHITFHGNIVATLDFSSAPWGRCLRVLDGVPATADAAFLRIAERMRETAKRADSIIQADKREVKRFIEACRRDADATRGPWTQEDMFLTTLAPPRDGGRVSVHFSYAPHRYKLHYASLTLPENTVSDGLAITVTPEGLAAGMSAPSDAILRPLAEAGRPVFAEMAADLDVPAAEAREITAAVVRHWTYGQEFDVTTHGLRVYKSHGVFVEMGGKVLCHAGVRAFDDASTRPRVELAHGGLPAKTQDALRTLITGIVLDHPSERPFQTNQMTPEQLGATVSEALERADFGYM